jgi:beta-galactosidase
MVGKGDAQLPQPETANPLPIDRIWLGVAYYPEQWPESLWTRDFAKMRSLGFEIVRMGEFAWSILEPEECQMPLPGSDRSLFSPYQ